MSTRIMPGIEDLSGREYNGILVERLASRSPVTRWHVRCVRCGTNWVEDHSRVRYVGCRNTACGVEPLGPRATLAATARRIEAVRSRDSDARRREFENPVPRESTGSERMVAGMMAADPSSLRHFIEYQEGKQ
jgi:hypothetical protein